MGRYSTWLAIVTFAGLLIVCAAIAWQWWKDRDGDRIAFLLDTLDEAAEEACGFGWDVRTGLLAEAVRNHRREDPLAIVHGRRLRRLTPCLRCARHRVRAA